MLIQGQIVQAVAHDVLVLFAMVNAVGNLPILSELTASLDNRQKRRAYRTAVLTAACIVITFAFLGDWMLRGLFQVDTGAFKIAGGILVFLVAVRGMVLGMPPAQLMQSDPQGNLGVFPMGFPFLAGPGTIVTTILLMQRGGAMITAISAAIVYLAVLPVLYLAPYLQRAGGRVAILVVSRILYIFIAAKAVTFILSGFKACFA